MGDARTRLADALARVDEVNSGDEADGIDLYDAFTDLTDAAREAADEIERLRAAVRGDGCDSCGLGRGVWWAPDRLWNLVMGGPDATDDPGGLQCPVCFCERVDTLVAVQAAEVRALKAAKALVGDWYADLRAERQRPVGQPAAPKVGDRVGVGNAKGTVLAGPVSMVRVGWDLGPIAAESVDHLTVLPPEDGDR